MNMSNVFEVYMANVLDELTTLGVVLTANLIIVCLVLLYVGFNAAVKAAADRFYERLEARRAQKAYDQWLTDHEMRYWERSKK